MKIVLAEKVSPATLAILQKEPGWNIVTADQIAPGGLPAELADADALIVRSAVQADAALLASAPKLRIIGRAGVGVDNIDAAEATRRGIVVMNTPGANAVAVAELTLGLMISMCRAIPRANATMHAAKWEKKSLQGSELRNKTLGIIGLGRIGLEVARRAQAFGMNVIGYDPFIAPVIARENNVTLLSLDEVFACSDFLSLHVGLTPQTEGLINQQSIARMKKGVRIVNCARGELIVDEALAAAVQSGQVAGAALDVFRQEPLKDSPYFGIDNILLSPHIAGSTDEAQEAIGIQLANQVRDYLKLGVVQNAVNVASLTEEEYAEVSPYIEMAARLGQLLSHASGSGSGHNGAGPRRVHLPHLQRPPRRPQDRHDPQRRHRRRPARSRRGQPHQRRLCCLGARHPHPGRQARADHRRHRRNPPPHPPLDPQDGQRPRDGKPSRALGPASPPSSTATRRACSATTASTSRPSSPEPWSSSATRMSPASSAASAPCSAKPNSTSPASRWVAIKQAATGSASSALEGHALAVVQLDIPSDGSTSTSPELQQALTALRQVDAITSVRTVELGKL